jgi:hypothetical protein
MTPDAARSAVQAAWAQLSVTAMRSAQVKRLGEVVGAVLHGRRTGSARTEERLVELAARALSAAWLVVNDEDVPDGSWAPRAEDLDPDLYLLHLVGQVGTQEAFWPLRDEVRQTADTACVELAQTAMYLLTGGFGDGEKSGATSLCDGAAERRQRTAFDGSGSGGDALRSRGEPGQGGAIDARRHALQGVRAGDPAAEQEAANGEL